MVITKVTLAAVFGLVLLLPTRQGWARTEFAEKEPPAPCARVQSFEGEVQVLDESRSRVDEVRYGEGIPCGSWISPTAGWLRFKHRDGWQATLAPGAFVQLLTPPSLGGDQLLVFRGQAYIKNGNGAPALSILTANSRIRVKDGAGIVAYLDSTEETQWVSTSGRNQLENRFQNARTIQVAEGESSTLNFHQLRVVPTEPMAVASAQLKKRLEEFRLDESEVTTAMAVVRKRQDRKIASVLGAAPVPVVSANEVDSGIQETRRGDRLMVQENPEIMHRRKEKDAHRSEHEIATERSPASASVPAVESVAAVKPSDYSRHPGVSADEREEVRSELSRKVAGSGPVTEDMISPDEGFKGELQPGAVKSAAGKLSVRDVEDGGRAPASESGKRKGSSQDREKKRLLEELSKIRVQ